MDTDEFHLFEELNWSDLKPRATHLPLITLLSLLTWIGLYVLSLHRLIFIVSNVIIGWFPPFYSCNRYVDWQDAKSLLTNLYHCASCKIYPLLQKKSIDNGLISVSIACITGYIKYENICGKLRTKQPFEARLIFLSLEVVFKFHRCTLIPFRWLVSMKS